MESKFPNLMKLIFALALGTAITMNCSSSEDNGQNTESSSLHSYGVYTYKNLEMYGWIEITISQGRWKSKSLTPGYMSLNRVQQDTMQGLVKGNELYDRTGQKKIGSVSDEYIVTTLGSVSAGWTGSDFAGSRVPVMLRYDLFR